MTLERGQTIDRYTVESVLGRGGMAVVYRVRHNTLGSLHALKVLTLTNASIRDRLLQEGRVQASMRHPNVVAVTDVLDVGGQPGLVMEFVDGPSLDGWLQSTPSPPLPIAEALFTGIVAGVAAAHAQGLVHRDLKPANVLLAPASGFYVPKVTDFGLAKALADGEDGGLHRTRSGMTMGTPAYMAPEQIRDAKNVDARADLFSLGCILYELVCGRPAFSGPDILSIFNAVANASFAPPVSLVPDLPPRIAAAITGCLVIDRERRIADCATLLRVLQGSASLSAAVPMPMPSVGASVGSLAAGFAAPAGAAPAVAGAVPETSSTLWAGDSFATEEIPHEPTSEPEDGSLAPTARSGPPTSSRPASSPPVAAPGRSGRRKWLLVGLAGVGVLGVAAVVGLAAVGVGGAWLFRSRQEAALVAVADRAGGEVTWSAFSLQPDAIVLDGVSVAGADGQPVLTAAEVRLLGNPLDIVAGDVDTVQIDGLAVHLRRSAGGEWSLPTRTLGLLDAPGARVGTLWTGPFEVDLACDEGTLKIAGNSAELGDVAFGGARRWTAGRATVRALTVAGAEPVASFGELTADADGGYAAKDAEIDVRTRTDGLADVPPVVADLVPTWLGGDAAEEGDRWLGIDPSPLPIAPSRLEITGGKLVLVDRAHAVKAVSWETTLDRLTVGPVAAGEKGAILPVSLAARLGDARLTVDGDLREDGLVRATAGVRYLPLDKLSPYLDASLKAYGVSVSSGSVDGRVDLSLKENAFASVLDAELQTPSFAAAAGATPARPPAKLIASARPKVEVEREASGDLASPDFLPVDDALHALADALFAPGGGAVWERRVTVSPPVAVPAGAPSARPVKRGTSPGRPTKAEASPDRPGAGIEEAAPAPTGEVAPDATEAPADATAEAPAEPAEPAEPAQPEAPAEPAKDPRDSLDKFNSEVRDALNDLRLPRRK